MSLQKTTLKTWQNLKVFVLDKNKTAYHQKHPLLLLSFCNQSQDLEAVLYDISPAQLCG